MSKSTNHSAVSNCCQVVSLLFVQTPPNRLDVPLEQLLPIHLHQMLLYLQLYHIACYLRIRQNVSVHAQHFHNVHQPTFARHPQNQRVLL